MEQDAQKSVSLSADVYDAIERRATHAQFDSADEYAEFVLDAVLAELDSLDDTAASVDEEELQNRLQSLGYLE